uniref:Uncharacterized protein n=1 Tax=Vitrella brassicaformis TaxID=1169539 RepID=A0A7S1K569_9ALVE|mmetsp:Transcript_38778/g.97028  ORF Transcript_38778/g.97028 Transcript_38778/m.97028 type:complete len:128 (+) Transcript_38778:261-644(+)
MPRRDREGALDCPNCKLKMPCRKHRNGMAGDIVKKVQNPKEALDSLYNDIIGKKLERFQRREEANRESSYWHQELDKQRKKLHKEGRSPHTLNMHTGRECLQGDQGQEKAAQEGQEATQEVQEGPRQ